MTRLSHAMQDAIRRLQEVAYQEAGMRGALVGVVVDARWGELIGVEPGDVAVVRVPDGAKVVVSCEAPAPLVDRVAKLEEALAKLQRHHAESGSHNGVDITRARICVSSKLSTKTAGDLADDAHVKVEFAGARPVTSEDAALLVACPICLAVVGERCRSTLGQAIGPGTVHRGRVEAIS